MFWTEEERTAFWKRNQIAFAERAYEFLCCDIPTIKMCLECNAEGYKNCLNKTEVLKIQSALPKPMTQEQADYGVEFFAVDIVGNKIDKHG